MIAGGMSGNAWSKRVDFFDAKRNVRFSVRGRACFGNREKHMGYEGRIRCFFLLDVECDKLKPKPYTSP